ncbi:MAG: cadherin domain-containing protein, partial [Limnohabitans sp.]
QSYTDSFTVVTADGSSHGVTVTIQGVNDAPVPVTYSDTIGINQSVTISTLVSGSTDPEGDSFSLTAATLRSGYTGAGTVSINNGNVVFTPTSNFSGQVFIDYTLTDSGQASSQGQISLWVGSNTAPTGADKTLTTLEDTSLVLQSSDFGFADVDAGQSLSAVQITQLPVHGQLLLDGVAVTLNQTITQTLIAAGKLSFVPAANANGTGYASVAFKVVDSGGLASSSSYTLTLDVTAVNDAPVFAQTSVSLDVDENTLTSTVIHTAQASDVEDGTTLSYSLSGTDASYFDINQSTGELTFKAAPNYEAGKPSYAVQVVATDSGQPTGTHILTATQNLTITLKDVNEAPTAISLSASTLAENNTAGAVVATLSATDPDGALSGNAGAFTYALVSGTGDTDNSAFTIVDNQLKLTGVANYEGQSSYSVRIQVTDAGGLTYQTTKTITVSDVNEAPTAISLSASTLAENNTAGAVVATLSATDPDGALSGNAGAFTYALVSGTGDTDNSAFTIVDNQLKLTGVANYEGQSSYSVRIQVTDAGGLTYQTTKTITVSDVNEAPTAISLSASTLAENNTAGAVVATLSATDPDGALSGNAGAFTYALVSGTGDTDNSAFTIVDNQLKLTGVANYEGQSSYSVRIQVTDAGGLTYQTTKTITVSDVNEAPVLAVLPAEAIVVLVNGYDVPLGATLVNDFTDPEAHALTFSTLDTLPDGIVLGSNGSITGKPTTDGTYSITLQVSDGVNTSSQAYTFKVVSQPVVVSVSASDPVVRSGDELTFTLTLSEIVTVDTTGGTPTLVLDVGGQTLTATYTSGSGSSSLVFSATASAGTDTSVAVTSLNLHGATVTGHVTAQALDTSTSGISVSNFVVDNTAPLFTSSSTATVAENTATSTAVYTVQTTDDTTVSYTLSGTDAQLFTLSNGVLKFKASPDFENPLHASSYQLSITATDAAGNSSTQSLTVGVTDVNEAPTAVALSNTPTSLAENTNTSSRVKVADIGITDDALGTNTVTLTGTDASYFEVDAGVLYLKAGTALNYESQSAYAVTVSVKDNALPGSTPVTTSYSLSLTDVNESPVYQTGKLPDLSLNLGQSGSFTLPVDTFVDPEGDSLTYSAYLDG